jgi:nucleoside phosphorylase
MVDVLIIDDDVKRARLLNCAIRDEVESTDGVANICCVSSAADGRNLMSSRMFDIVVLDIVLPVYKAGVAREGGGLALVEELFNTDILHRPRFMVGVSAHRDSAARARELFEEVIWNVIFIDTASNEWVDRLKAVAKHAALTCRSNSRQLEKLDAIWITALRDPELEAVIQPTCEWAKVEPIGALPTHFVSKGERQGPSVAALSCSTMGNVEAAILTQAAIDAYSPDMAVLSGICGGVGSDVRLGDILVARDVWDWQGGKFTDQGFVPDINVVNSSRALVDKANELRCDSAWLSEVWRSFKGAKPEHPPKIHIGAIASGSLVVASSEISAEISERKRKTVGIEMEAFGFQYACQRHDRKTIEFITVKGVCDLADSEKNDDYQAYAAYISAAACKSLLGR